MDPIKKSKPLTRSTGEPHWLPVCAGSALLDGGLGVRFELPRSAAAAERGAAAVPGFAVRVNGEVRAYVNRCAHVPVELDWQPGQFFDETGRYLVCSTHGAIYEADSGLCVAGPCRGAALSGLHVKEDAELVYVADPRVFK